MIKTTYLKIEKQHFQQTITTAVKHDSAALQLMPAYDPTQCAALYKEIGKAYYWDIYRIGWTLADWHAYLNHPAIDIALISTAQRIVGYLELKHHGSSVEIVNFGLKPDCIGLGLGKAALEAALQHGFASGVGEVWLHTCSLDHPAALSNYYARGFKLLKEVEDNYLPLDLSPSGAGVQLA